MNNRPIRYGTLIGILTMGVLGAFPRPVPFAPCPLVWAEEVKIGYVDLLKIFDGYEKTKALDASLEQKGKQKQTELEGRVSALKKLRQNLELLTDQARDLRAREIEEKSDELQRFRTSAARDIARERDKITKGLLDEIQAGVEGYAKANGFAIIMDRRALLYGVQAYDVTDEVLALLNSRVKKPQ